MTKLGELLDFVDYPKGEIGLEIETESLKNYAVISEVNKYWTAKADGSLRNVGVEFVFNQPLNFKSYQYVEAMDAFEKQTKAVKFHPSPYASVHVHFNMLDKEPIELMNFFTLYFLFEELFGEYCGADRHGSLFCLPTNRAEIIYRNIKMMAQAINEGAGYNFIRQLNNGSFKYSGLNVVPLRTLGSVEVRTHGCTYDRAAIDRWVGILYKLYERSSKYKTPVEIVNQLQKVSLRSFVVRHLEEYSEFFNLFDLEKKMEDGIWYASSLAGAVDDWSKFTGLKNKKQAFKSRKKPDVPVTTWGTATVVPHDWQPIITFDDL